MSAKIAANGIRTHARINHRVCLPDDVCLSGDVTRSFRLHNIKLIAIIGYNLATF